MKKKCMAIAKKAIVWTMAASMLVATPLTASAKDLNGVFSISDGKGNDNIGPDGKDQGKPNGNPSRTGTVTNTETNSRVLSEDKEAKIVGLALNQTKINAVKGKTVDLTAIILTTGSESLTDEQAKELKERFTWKVADPETVSIKVNAITSRGDRSTATLNPRQGGKTTVTVSLDDYKRDIHFTKTADVFVKEYADDISFKEIDTQFVKHTLDLNDDCIVPIPATANDDIIFDIDSTYDADNAKGVATIKNGILTFKKVGKVRVNAVSEQGKTDSVVIDVKAGEPITKLEITKDGVTTKDAKMDVSKENEETMEVGVKRYYSKAKTEWVEGSDVVITDDITWMSKKPAIIDVENKITHNADGNTLIPKSVGKAQVVATATSGQKATLNVTVEATLTGLEITNIEENTTMYSGQTLQVEVTRKSGDNEKFDNWNKDNLKYSVEKINNKANPDAKINAKGLLTIQNVIKGASEETGTAAVTIKVEQNKKGVTTPYSDSRTLSVKQSNVSKIVVQDVHGEALITVDATGKKVTTTKGTENKGKISIAKDKSKTYKVVAYQADGETTTLEDGTGNLASTLNWSSSKVANATVTRSGDDQGIVKGIKKGSSNIVVSGIQFNQTTKKAKVLKATVSATITQPATYITMNKTLVTIKATGKAQTVSLKATPEKGSTSKVTTWKVRKVGEDTPAKDTTKSGKLALGSASGDYSSYAAGDEYIVTAIADNGASASTTVKVVSPSTAVMLHNTNKKLENGAPVAWEYTPSGKTKVTKNAAELTIGDDPLELKAYVNVGTKNDPEWVLKDSWNEEEDKYAAAVDYSVNKKGVVQIIGNKVYALKKGSVKITAKTADGKSYKLTVNVVLPAAPATNN